MLARAARRKLRRDAFQSPTHLSGQLWQRPAQIRCTASTNSIYTPSEDSRKQRIPSLLASRHEIRSLTTTAELQPSPSQASINGFMRPWAPQAHSSGLSTLQPWDPANPLVLRDSYQAPFTNFNYGIGGDPSELYQNLYACLRVGRMDRAFAIIQRLTRLYEPSAPELTEAHNVYLQTMFELAQQDPKPNSLTEIEDFFDNRIVRQAIEPNAQTFVTLLRAAMNFLEEDAQVNAIRRYLAMAHEYSSEMVQEINCAPEFSDEEWDLLLRLQPDTFEEPPPIEQVQEIQISTPAGRKSLIEHGLLPETVYSIKPVPQKGMGLKTLKSALTSFDYAEEVPYPHEMEGTREEKDLAYNQARQLRLEQDSLKAAIARWKAEDEKLQEMGIHGVLKTKNIQALMWNWYSALLPRVQEEIKKVKEVLANPTPENRTDDRHVYGPWLERSDPAKVAAITISRVIVGCAQDSNDESGSATLKISTLASRISRDIEQTHNQSEKQRRDQFIRKRRLQARTELIDKLAKIKTSLDNTQAQKPEGDAQAFEQFTRTEFPLSVRTKIGALALDLLLQTAKITVTAEDPQTGKQLTCTQAAFQHRTGFAAGKRVGWVSPHKEVLHKLRTDPVHKIETIKMPMVFEPKPWTSSSSGGYYTYNSHVVRSKSGDQAQRAYTQSALENGDMKKVLEGLNVLGKVPWQINKEVFEVMAQVWNSGEGLGGLIPEEPDLERPEEPPADASYKERTGWASKIKEYENIKSGLHSQRCFQNFQLEIARGFLREKKIYFPHSVDFRGRAYPIPPLLNHIGSDISRGLLKFANGKELGTVGLQWLKVHLANLYGYDKASLREREQFAMDNMNEIYDSATNPLNGRRWWVKAEDPWQCLACCMELKNALDSPDPTRYVSQLPVHQDGTCNGLQHYAALGGDLAGATQVNLEPSDRPQDIYTGVATLVAEMVAEEAAKGDPRAQLMDGKITRKIVKRTVMTNVYGVTFMGAKAQVLTELKDIFPNFKESESVKNLAQVALYIAHKIFSALGKIFNGAQEIQYWLGECGNRITTSISADQVKKMQERMAGVPVSTYGPQYQKPPRQNIGAVKKMNKQVEAFKTSIIWTTPLKMPVVQPYRRDATQVIKTPLQDINVYSKTTSHTVNKRKQLQAFPPNFIHSLDASHMLLSALKCSELGLDFAAVHDSFWTHAADIPNMNTVLREAFVRMHSEDIVSRLAAEFKARYAGSMYRANLQYKSAVAQKIVAWRQEHCKEAGIAPKRASFREASFTEVALEATRQELLNSDDPVKRKEGEEMVTPTSIWLAEQDTSTLTSHRLELLGEMKEKSDQTVEPVDVFNDDDLDDNSKPEPKRSQWEVYVWLPLTFPPVPKKGGWDVSRLRESKYFFS